MGGAGPGRRTFPVTASDRVPFPAATTRHAERIHHTMTDHAMPWDEQVAEEQAEAEGRVFFTDRDVPGLVARYREEAVDQLVRGARDAVVSWRDPDAVAAAADDLRSRVLSTVRVYAESARRERRPGRITSSTVAAELAVLGDAHAALVAASDAIKAGAEEARSIAGEIVAEVEPEKTKGTATVTVGDGHGQRLKVTRTQATKAVADPAAIIDVLVAANLAELSRMGDVSHVSVDSARWYAEGLRNGIAALLEIIGPPAWKTSALDALAKGLEAREEYDLAIKLGHAYGRVAHGEPKTKIERVPGEVTS